MVATTKSLDDALDEIVELAKIPKDSRSYFRILVRSTVNDWAIPRIKKLRSSDKSTASQLKAVRREAASLACVFARQRLSSYAGAFTALAE